ncbi:MAG: glycosyltransferase [Desulfobacteraceae bacterium]|nr:glycosyltransferase [Desulfobacteraceae bacterium]
MEDVIFETCLYLQSSPEALQAGGLQLQVFHLNPLKKADGSIVYWEYFDKIYCISLDERTDRREEATVQFDAVGLSGKVDFVVVKKHPVDCEQGIYESHILCMKKGIHAKADNMAIFEDDVCFDRFSPETLKNSIDFLSSNANWNIMFLGCLIKRSGKIENASVVRVKFRSLCHAYVLNAKFAERMVKIPWQKVPFDDMLRDLKDDHLYAIYPSFAFQSNSRSDNHKCISLDRIRRLCGGLRRIQKMNEFYHRNRMIIIGAHVLVLLILIGMLTV